MSEVIAAFAMGFLVGVAVAGSFAINKYDDKIIDDALKFKTFEKGGNTRPPRDEIGPPPRPPREGGGVLGE